MLTCSRSGTDDVEEALEGRLCRAIVRNLGVGKALTGYLWLLKPGLEGESLFVFPVAFAVIMMLSMFSIRNKQ